MVSRVFHRLMTRAMEQPTIRRPPINSPQRMLRSSMNPASNSASDRRGGRGGGVGSAGAAAAAGGEAGAPQPVSSRRRREEGPTAAAGGEAGADLSGRAGSAA